MGTALLTDRRPEADLLDGLTAGLAWGPPLAAAPPVSAAAVAMGMSEWASLFHMGELGPAGAGAGGTCQCKG